MPEGAREVRVKRSLRQTVRGMLLLYIGTSNDLAAEDWDSSTRPIGLSIGTWAGRLRIGRERGSA